MKTLKVIISSSIIAVATLAVTAQADELMDIIHPESADLFHFDNTLKSSEQAGAFIKDDLNGAVVWSYEYEQYVDQTDFSAKNNINNINRYMESNPTAAGKPIEDVFKWDPTYDGYMYQ